MEASEKSLSFNGFWCPEEVIRWARFRDLAVAHENYLVCHLTGKLLGNTSALPASLTILAMRSPLRCHEPFMLCHNPLY